MPSPVSIRPVKDNPLAASALATSENSGRIHASGFSFAGFPWPFFAVLFLSAFISLLWSHYALLDTDEFRVLWTDRVASLGQIVHIQLTGPISVDPILYHALAHGFIRVFGENAFAIRLPSLIGFLMMQVCLFVFVRRFAGERAALLAMAFPVLTRAFFFSMDARPYGLLLGLLGVAMVSWQSATREEGRRLIPLILLALALAMILNTSYSGVLLFAPFCIAEFFRTFQRRRIDLPMVAAIGAGGAGIVPVLPFMKAAMQHRSYYYFPSELIAPRTIFKVYLQVFSPASRAFDDAKLNPRLAIVLIILALALLGLILRGRRRYSPRSNPEMVLLAVLVLLPVLGFLLGRFGTHSFEPRHSIGMALGVAGFAGIGISTYPWGKRAANLILTVFLLAIVLFGIRSIHQARSVTQKTMSALLASPEVKAAIMASPSQQLYTGSFDLFEKLTYYETDPYIQAHITLVFSRDQEIRYRHMDTESLAAMHMLTFTQFNIVPWETLIAQPGDHVFVFHPNSDWDWTQRALAVDHAEVKPVGQAFGADVVSVRFRP